MKKNLFLAALATIALAACNGDLADEPPVVTPPTPEPQEIPIVFSSSSNGTTRTEFTGAVAADMLGKKFVVSGYKGDQTATVGGIVYDNFLVEWIENSANTTQSNTANWEYVGRTPIYHATQNGVTQQAIKYWDYTQKQYDFIAWSAGKKTAIYTGTPGDGEVLVSAITPATATGENGTAYVFEGKAKDLVDCYIADLVTVKKDGTGKGAYGEPVTLTFRSLGTKVRIGIYETIPGYSVKDVEFYSGAATDDADATKPRLFTTELNQIYLQGIYTVFYPTVDAADNTDNNQVHVRFTGTGDKSKIVDFGGLQYGGKEDAEKTAGNVFLGRTSNTASMAGEAEGNYYTQYLPNEGGTNLNLRVNYTLESIDGTGEIIKVKGATAQVPGIYTQWKAGYAYTYLFKISDKTNGHTGDYDPLHPDDTEYNPDPAGLYPITFDAVVVNDEEDATQETITLVSTPSITTYQKGSKVVDNDEYLAATGPIFVTVNDGTTESTPDLANGKLQTLAGKVALYTIPGGKTESEVVDAFQIPDDNAAEGTAKGRNGLVLTNAQFELTNKIEYGVDGNTITVEDDQVMRFTASPGTYAFVYTKKAPTENIDKFQYVTKAVGDDVTALYRNFDLTAVTGDAQPGTVYMSKNAAGVLTRETVFLGQSAGNLYTRTGAGTAESPYEYTAATTGRAVSGTTYYYTPDNGNTYQLATNIAYADFATATLYTDATATNAKTETKPVSGKAYYTAEGAFCVILPQQVNGWYQYLYSPSDKFACQAGEKALEGAAYFDKYYQNNGVYYTKIIKVQ
ncbi:MAG: hypothetical protein J6T44_10410 [Prevotella sp.]|nr:hypothetical protein [Prevotella sp.]